MENREEEFYNVKILRDYEIFLRKQLNWSQSQIDDLFHSIGSDVSFVYSDDNWFNQDYADRFYKAVVQLSGDDAIAFKVGRFTMVAQSKGIIGRIVQGVLYPQILFNNIQRLAKFYTKGSSYETIKMTKNSALIRSTPVHGCQEKFYQCQNRIGVLKGILEIFNCRSVSIKHEICLYKGSNYCEYELSWKTPWQLRPGLAGVIFFCFAFVLTVLWMDSWLALVLSVLLGETAYIVLSNRQYFNLEENLKEQNDALEISMSVLDRRHRESLVVRDFMNATTQTMPLDTLLNNGIRLVKDKLHYDRIVIFLVDQMQGVLKTKASVGYHGEKKYFVDNAEFQIKKDNQNGFLINVVNNGKPVFIRDIEAQKHKLSHRSQRLVEKLGIESLIAVPIAFEQRIIGVLTIENESLTKPLTANDLDVAKSIGDHFAIAITNSERYMKIEQALERVEKLQKVELQQKKVFQRYVPTEVVDEIVFSDDSLGLRRETLSVMFVDINAFTLLSEQRLPEEVADILNVYIEVVNRIVVKNGGRINKIVGDGLLIYFPLNTGTCLKASLELIHGVEEINRRLREKGHQSISIGIGVHRGICTLGNIGCVNRADYTLIGDTVNTASRLENYTREIGPNSICFSDSLIHEAKSLDYVELGNIQLRGRLEPVRVFHLIGTKEALKSLGAVR